MPFPFPGKSRRTSSLCSSPFFLLSVSSFLHAFFSLFLFFLYLHSVSFSSSINKISLGGFCMKKRNASFGKSNRTALNTCLSFLLNPSFNPLILLSFSSENSFSFKKARYIDATAVYISSEQSLSLTKARKWFGLWFASSCCPPDLCWWKTGMFSKTGAVHQKQRTPGTTFKHQEKHPDTDRSIFAHSGNHLCIISKQSMNERAQHTWPERTHYRKSWMSRGWSN